MAVLHRKSKLLPGKARKRTSARPVSPSHLRRFKRPLAEGAATSSITHSIAFKTKASQIQVAPPKKIGVNPIAKSHQTTKPLEKENFPIKVPLNPSVKSQ
jgi:hypothetical protein